MISEAKSTAKDIVKPSLSNPLVQFGVGGLGSALGIWLFARIYGFITVKFPAIGTNKFGKPLAKTVTALVLYTIGNLKSFRKIPMLKTFVFGCGIGIFGSMVSDFIMEKINNIPYKASQSPKPLEITQQNISVSAEPTINADLYGL